MGGYKLHTNYESFVIVFGDEKCSFSNMYQTISLSEELVNNLYNRKFKWIMGSVNRQGQNKHTIIF